MADCGAPMSRSESRRIKCLKCPARITLSFDDFIIWSDNPKRYIDAIGGKEGAYDEGGWVCGMCKGRR